MVLHDSEILKEHFFLVLFHFGFSSFFMYVEKPECLGFSVGFLDNKMLLLTLNKISFSSKPFLLSIGSSIDFNIRLRLAHTAALSNPKSI